MTTKALLDEFVYAIPARIEEQQVIPRQGGLFFYQAMLLSGAPVNFGEHASREVIDQEGNQLFIPFKLLYGTPHAVSKASEAEVRGLFEEMLAARPKNRITL